MDSWANAAIPALTGGFRSVRFLAPVHAATLFRQAKMLNRLFERLNRGIRFFP
jgi:hypothetical protein